MVHSHFHRSMSRLCSYWELGTKTCQFMHIVPDKHQKMRKDEKRAFKFDMLEKGAMSNINSTVLVPTCTDCLADHFCRAVRINNAQFQLSPSQGKRVEQFVEGCLLTAGPPVFSQPLLLLYKNYVRARHGNTNTNMVNHTADDFKEMLNACLWMVQATDKKTGEIIAFALVDQYRQSFSLEYLAYDTGEMKRVPGLSTTLAIAHMLKMAYPDGYLYMGSWSPGSPKLNYKNQFHGLEIRGQSGWQALPRNAGPEDAPQPPSLLSFQQT